VGVVVSIGRTRGALGESGERSVGRTGRGDGSTMRKGPVMGRGANRYVIGLLVAVVLAVGACTPAGPSGPPPESGPCDGPHWVASWGAAQSDALIPSDATFGALPRTYDRQTIRNVITPHLGGGRVRLHLTNRYNFAPVTFDAVTIGPSQPDGGVTAPASVHFAGMKSVTLAPGEDAVSDPLNLSVEPFAPLAVSLYVPKTVWQVTKHWNSNATTYLTAPGAGDLTGATSGAAFTQRAESWLGVLALDVEAGPSTRAIVAFGDSITDGWVGSSALSRLDTSVSNTNSRYPDQLQRRILDRGLPLSVINAGLGSNQVLGSIVPLAGPSAVSRFTADVPYFASARGVIIFEGINDLGLSHASAGSIIDGLNELVAQARTADLKVWLATITPASNSVIHGLLAPDGEGARQIVNQWIRTQTVADGYFDFDRAVADPANPAVLAAQYGSVDHLHLNPAGYQRLADTVDLDQLDSTHC